ncbi:MAG: phosphotransferase family protein, partial [Armatimonadota bacterium]
AGPRELERILEQTGRYLREIHEITSDRYGYLGAHHCMEPQRDWASAFRVMWNKMTDDIVRAGYYDQSEASYVRALLDSHYACFDRPVTSRLLHMDIWSQNILVNDHADVTGIIDFDRALWGDKEIEFAVLDYCGISEPAFWKGYGLERDTSREAHVRWVFYLAYEVQKYIVIRHYRHRDPGSAARYKQQSLALLARLRNQQ